MIFVLELWLTSTSARVALGLSLGSVCSGGLLLLLLFPPSGCLEKGTATTTRKQKRSRFQDKKREREREGNTLKTEDYFPIRFFSFLYRWRFSFFFSISRGFEKRLKMGEEEGLTLLQACHSFRGMLTPGHPMPVLTVVQNL